MTKLYPALIHKDPDSDYGVSFPDFPGCVSAGKTLAEASRFAEEALALHIEGMLEDGDTLPEPMSIQEANKLVIREKALSFLLISANLKGRGSGTAARQA